jgi:OOP family OmpA-OmpF porin
MRCRQSADSVQTTESSFVLMPRRGLAQMGQADPATVRVMACALIVGGVIMLGWTSRVALHHQAITATATVEPVSVATVVTPLEEPVVSTQRHVQLPQYPASLSLVNDATGLLLSCVGTIGDLNAAKALNTRIDAAYPNNQTECHFVVDAAYHSQLLNQSTTLSSLLAALQQQRDAMLAINVQTFDVHAQPAIDSVDQLIVSASTIDETQRLRDRVTAIVGDTAHVEVLGSVNEPVVLTQRLQAAKQLMTTLPATGVRPADIMRVLNTQILAFAPHQSVLPVANQVVLTQAARWLKQHPQLIVDVRGFTEGVGNVAYNMALGQQRADAVRTFWMAQGVAKHQVRTSGMGGIQPIASNVSPQGQFYNRRLEFWAYNSSDVHLQAAPRADVAVGADD